MWKRKSKASQGGEVNAHLLSYSQAGEDRIIKCLLDYLQIHKPFYVDIGAYHPHYLSNTMLFYSLGGRGINIEPNPIQFELFKKMRAEDINLNIGIGATESILPFYQIDSPTLSTFDLAAAKELVSSGNHEIQNTYQIPVKHFNWIIDNYLKIKPIDILSVDVEGMDAEILESINWQIIKPKIICIETVNYTTNFSGEKDITLIQSIKERGYRLFADTYINSIFVDSEILPESI